MAAPLSRLSVIVPVLDEAGGMAECLQRLQPLRARGHEVIVVDGGSRDATASIAAPLADLLCTAPRGRAIQMNAGAQQAAGDALVFLHADTWLPPQADIAILSVLGGALWGRFDVRIEGRHPLLPVIAAAMNLRSRLTGIATGDQAVFVRRAVFHEIGGYAPIALMEDIELSRRLKRRGPPACLRMKVSTSGRRWDERGAVRTILLMWRLRLAYWLGADPASIARRYR